MKFIESTPFIFYRKIRSGEPKGPYMSFKQFSTAHGTPPGNPGKTPGKTPSGNPAAVARPADEKPAPKSC